MKYPEEAFKEILKHCIEIVEPNEILDCELIETNEYQKLWKELAKHEHPFWKRVVLNYSAKLCDSDLAFYGINSENIINDFEKLFPGTVEQLFLYYYHIDLNKWEEDFNEDDEEYYFTNQHEKISRLSIEKFVAIAVCNDYNELHSFIDGHLNRI